jgi:branched-chain amino acid aminotransferase
MADQKVDTTAPTLTWNYVDGEWIEGNVPIIGTTSHAAWLGSTVFDGARWFEGLAPDLDLHCERVNASALALGLQPTKTAKEIEELALEGIKRFDGKTAVYIKPMYWAEHGGYSLVPADPASTRFCLTMFETPMLPLQGFTVSVSPFRRPSIENAPTNAKAGCLYPNYGRALLEARSRGFGNALVLDMLGNVAETASSNVFMVKEGVVYTPVANGTFLAGITRMRIMTLLKDAGHEVVEKSLKVSDFMDADEIFSTGNHSKVLPIIGIEDKTLQIGPIATKSRKLYMEWAKAGS